MKKLRSLFLTFVILTGFLLSAAAPTQTLQATAETAEWSILWLIVPELDATPAGGTPHKSTTSPAVVTKLQNMAVTFKRDVEKSVRDLNGLELTLHIDVRVSDIPLRSISNGSSPSWMPTDQDLAPILDKYAPRRQKDYDSLIVMGEFSNLHNYGGINWGWTSFCPLPYAASDFLGYNIMLHEWGHHMEGISNNILRGTGRCPSFDGMSRGSYLDNYISAKYPGVTGEAKATKYYFELLAGTLPVDGNNTSGVKIEYWQARPTSERPNIEFTYTDAKGTKGTVEWTVSQYQRFG